MTSRLTLGRTAAAAIFIVTGLLVGGCAGSTGDTNSTSAGAAKDGGDLTIVGFQEMTTLDKDIAGTSNDALRVLENVYDRLYVLDDKAQPAPSLALGHTLSDDKLTWTFKLRTDAKFSDGAPVTAKDVVFSLDLARKGPYGGLLAKVTSVTAEGGDTVVLKTSQPDPIMLELITMENAGVVKDNFGGISKDEYYKKPIGSGPWMFESVTQGVGVKLVPNPHWWGTKAHLDSITFNTVADANTRLIQLRSGQAQLIETPDFSQLDSINTGNTTVLTFPSTEVDFFAMNTTKAPFDDVHFRRAVSLALDRQALNQAAVRGKGTPATSWVAESALDGYMPPTGTKLDLAAAKDELAKSATPTWTKPIEIQYSATGASGWPLAAQVIQANLKELGLTVEIQAVDTNAIQAAREKKTFDIQFRLLTLDIPDSSELIEYYFATNGYNSFVDLTESKRLYAEAAAEFDLPKRIEGFRKVMDHVVNGDAATPAMYNVPYFWGASKSLQGMDAILTGQFRFNDLWLS